MKGAPRLAKRNPGLAAAAILTIALGIGANTAVFSVVEAVLMRPLPYADPDRLVTMWETHPELARLQVAAPDYADWAASAKSFEGMAAYSMQVGTKVTVIGAGAPFQAQATTASWNLFDVLGVKPVSGRFVSQNEDGGRRRVMVISERLWRSRFGGARDAVGRVVRLGPDAWTIAGVVPQESAMPGWADLWLPYSYLDSGTVNERQFHPLEVVARLRPGASEAQAQAELSGIAARLSRQYPATNKTIGAAVIRLDAQTKGEVRPALIALWSAVGLILLIACANVAHLLVARAVSERRESAIRAALGASRWQLVRRSLGESLTLAAAGGAVGLWVAWFALPALKTLAAGRIPRMEGVTLDGRVFAFSLGLMLVCGVLAGVLPALSAVGASLNDVLKSGAGAVARRGRTGPALVVAEVALALMVMAGAGLLMRSYAKVLSGEPGFRGERVLTAELSLPFAPAQSEKVLLEEILPRLRAIPGVEAAANVNAVPGMLKTTERSRFATRFGMPGRAYEPGKFPVAQSRWMTPDYFDAMGIRLRSGRRLTEQDRNQPMLLINETLARTYFAGENAVGKSLLLGVMLPKPQEVRIVGVVEDVRELGLESAAPPALYSIGSGGMIVVRAAGSPAQLTGAVRAAVAAVNPEFATGRMLTMTEIGAESLARRRFALLLMLVFAGVGAALAAVGIYGVMAYSVSARTRELGLRQALGAQRGDVLTLVLRESGAQVLAGLALGTAGALAASRVVSSLLYSTSPADPLAFGGSALALALCGLAAASGPARRASRVDPMTALREQ